MLVAIGTLKPHARAHRSHLDQLGGWATELPYEGARTGRKGDGANAWCATIKANLVKADVSLPNGARITSHTDGVLIVRRLDLHGLGDAIVLITVLSETQSS